MTKAERRYRSRLLKKFNRNSFIIHEDANIVIIASGFERDSENSKTGAMIQIFILYKRMNPVQAIATGNDYWVCGNCSLRQFLQKQGVKHTSDYAEAKSLGWRCFVQSKQTLPELAVCPTSDEAIAARKAKGIHKDVTCKTCGLCRGNSLPARDIQIQSHGANPDKCYVEVKKSVLSVWQAYKRGRYARLVDLSMFNGRYTRFGAYGDPVLIPYPIVKAIAGASRNFTGYTHQWRKPTAQAYKDYFMASCMVVEA